MCQVRPRRVHVRQVARGAPAVFERAAASCCGDGEGPLFSEGARVRRRRVRVVGRPLPEDRLHVRRRREVHFCGGPRLSACLPGTRGGSAGDGSGGFFFFFFFFLLFIFFFLLSSCSFSSRRCSRRCRCARRFWQTPARCWCAPTGRSRRKGAVSRKWGFVSAAARRLSL